jgi:hypothetical protein
MCARRQRAHRLGQALARMGVLETLARRIGLITMYPHVRVGRIAEVRDFYTLTY